MPDVDQMDSESAPDLPAPTAPSRGRVSIFRDPVVRWMAIIAALLVILYLVTVISAAVMGFFTPTRPRTRAERDLRFYEMAAMQTPEDPAVWKAYISSLITSRQYLQAQDVIDQATAAIDQTGTEDILTAQAQLYLVTGEYEQAIKAADEIRARLKKYYDAAVKKKDSAESKGEGINENYWSALIIKSEAQTELGETEAAIKSLDEYLEANPTAADVLVRRGDLLAEKGDNAGAEKDYRAALQFIPDDESALAGLEKIGASE